MLKILITAAIVWTGVSAYERLVADVMASGRDSAALHCAYEMHDGNIKVYGWHECMKAETAKNSETEVRTLALQGLWYAATHPSLILSRL